jgi:PIN domain nuclease of toxin-antitoxin system
VKYLLDSHVVVWMMLAPDRLGRRARAVLEDGRSALSVSVVSLWEIEYKRRQGRIDLPEGWSHSLPEHGVSIRPLNPDVALLAAGLNLHGDPFDRMVAAEAALSGAVLMTADEKLLRAVEPVVDARA